MLKISIMIRRAETQKEGYVQRYYEANPAWPEWVKIGMAIDAEDRLNLVSAIRQVHPCVTT